jgi:hypothetical protein
MRQSTPRSSVFNLILSLNNLTLLPAQAGRGQSRTLSPPSGLALKKPLPENPWVVLHVLWPGRCVFQGMAGQKE